MLLKASCLNKLLASRSKLAINHYASNNLTNTTSVSFLLGKTRQLSSLQNKSSSNLFQFNLYKTNFNLLGSNSFHTNSTLKQQSPNDSNTTKKGSILDTPVSSPNSSILTDDLVKKYAGSVQEDKAQETSSNKQEAKSEEKANDGPKENQGRFAKMFSREHGWKVSLAFITLLTGGMGFYFLATFGPEKLDENNNPIKDEFSELPMAIQYPKRAFYSMISFYDMMKKPSTERLLPDPIQPPYYQPPYTLVIEMTGIMLHPEWTFSTGWRYKKRPGLEYFIDQIKYPQFEVVLFTREPFISGAPIVASLDPQQNIQFKLFRESTQFVNNHFVKDLSYMNRDPSKIIVIDWDEQAYQLQPRNALHRLKKWDGDENDADLVYLASFLKLIANSGVADVREVLDYYNKEIDPLETFKLKQVQIKEAEMQRLEEIKAMKEKQQSKFSLFRR